MRFTPAFILFAVGCKEQPLPPPAFENALLVDACEPTAPAFTVVSYNIKSGIFHDRDVDKTCPDDVMTECIADHLANSDVVLLQEVGCAWSEEHCHPDQAEQIARRLGDDYQAFFYPVLDRGDGEPYGIAVVTHLKVRKVEAVPLPRALFDLEQRGAIRVSLCVGDGEVDVVGTHLDVLDGRRQQIEAIRDALATTERVIVGGDFNEELDDPDEGVSGVLSAWGLRDSIANEERGRSTLFVGGGGRIDAVFTTIDIAGTTRVLDDPLFSDHAPIGGTLSL